MKRRIRRSELPRGGEISEESDNERTQIFLGTGRFLLEP